jgi:hypothetical protein
MLNHEKGNNLTHRDFCYWLQGFFETREPGNINAREAAVIEEHLQLTMTKVTHESVEFPRVLPVMKPFGLSDGHTFGLGPCDINASC